MGLLTDFFLPVASQYVSARYGGPPARVNDVTHFAGLTGKTPGAGMIGGVGMDEPGGGIPGFDIIKEPTMQNCGPKPVYKYSCGGYRWVYPKRRRRKQLLTNSDAAGLAKLKGLVGVGKTMDTWIATHS